MLKKIYHELILAIIGGILYYMIEVVFRGHSHITMAILGSICFVCVGALNNYLPWDMLFWQQCFYGCIIITVLEGLSGLLLNVWLKLGIWDYSQVPFNFFFHQCSLPFCLIWFILAGVAIVLDDVLRNRLFGEEMPHYDFGIK